MKRALWPVLLAVTAAGCLDSSSSATPTTVTPPPSTSTSRAGIPNVVGLPVLAAANRLQRAGFAVTTPRIYLSSQTPEPVVKRESPAAGSILMPGNAVTLHLEYRCCIGSPAVSTNNALIMPSVVGQPLDVALQQVTEATGFYDVSIPPTMATLQPLLATYRVTKQWPQPGFDLRHQTNGFRLPSLTVVQN